MDDRIVSRKDALAQGLKFYFTGKPCANGHVCQREVSDWKCLECRRAKSARKRQANREEINAQRRERYAKDPEYRELQKEKSKQWSCANPEVGRASTRKYVNGDRARVLGLKKANNAARRAKPEIREQERKATLLWKSNNPEKVRSYVRNRRAIKRNAEGHHTDSDIATLWANQNGSCVYCKEDLTITGHHVDHIVPLSKGGSNWPSNLQCLCPDCNLRKWNLSEDEFLSRK